MSALEKVQAAWIKASQELGFEFVAPFEIEYKGSKIRYVGLVRDFGSENGMALFVSEKLETEPWASVAKKNGFGYSCLGRIYSSYEREEFIAALDDWQWVPKDRKPPAWYSGQPWSE